MQIREGWKEGKKGLMTLSGALFHRVVGMTLGVTRLDNIYNL